MTSAKILCFGELIVDMFSAPPKNGAERECFYKYVGGSPAIVASAIATLGSRSYFIGKLSKDMFGDFLMNAMDDKGIRMNYCAQSESLKSTISFVSHDKDGERHFNIYRDSLYASDLAFLKEDWNEEWFRNALIFHCGSNCQTKASSHQATEYGMKLAQKNNLLVSYDPNIRPKLWEDDELLRMRVHRLFPYADLIKFSDDEAQFLFPNTKEETLTKNLFELGCSLVLITRGGKGCSAFSKEGDIIHLKGIKSKVVDTTVAGDNFIVATLFKLSKIYSKKNKKLIISSKEIQDLLDFANNAAALSVTKAGGVDSSPSLNEVESQRKQK